MAIGFRRNFRLLERLFPQSGISSSDFPSYVDGTVVPHWDIFDVRPGDVQWDLRRIPGVSAGTTATVVGVEPPAGYIFLPQAVTVQHDDVTAAEATLFIVEITTSQSDPWGNWFDLFPGAGIAFPLETVTVPVGGIARFASPLPAVMRKTRLQVNFAGLLGAGINLVFNTLGVFVPGEAVRLEHWNK